LDTEPRRLLELISCHDGDLHLREAVEATELVNDTALAAVDELRRRRLIEASGELIVGDHEVMRRVIYEELPAARRIDLHRRLGEAIEQSRPGEAEFLAHHFTQARIPERAAAFHEQAAGLASDVHAFDRSSHYWTQALAQLNEIGAPSDRRYRAARELEQVLDVLARREDQEYALAQMARWASTDSQRAEVAWRRAWWLAHQDRFQEARVEAERAVTSASELADAGLKLEAFTTAGMIHCYSGSALEGVELLERATGVDGPSARQLADARNALGQNLIDLQRFDEAKSHLLAALDLYREADNARGQAEVLGTLATMRMETGDPDSAERDFNAAIQMSQAIGYRHGEAVYEMNLGILYVITNRIASAIQSFMRAETRYAAMGNRRGRALVLSNSAWLLHGLVGDDDEATSQITEARAIYDEIGDERGLAHCEALLGSMHGRKHEIDKAHELFESALERTRRLDDSWLTAQGLREYAATDLENGNIASGTKHILEAESLCADFGFNDLLVGVRALAARLLLRDGRVEEAETRARRAMRELRTGVEFAHLVPFAACEVDDVLGRTESADAHIANSKSQLDAMLSELDPDQRERSWAAIPNHVSIAARWRSATPERLEISAATLPEHRAEVGSSVCVSVTVRDPADDAIPDRVARRRRQIQRIIEEAASQFGVLTTKQLASLLGAGDATIRRDLAALRAEGAELATKGSRSNHQ
jgi:tetratricopeptide (TPR) repeat protein